MTEEPSTGGIAWWLIGTGLVLQIAGIFEPLSPFPVIEWLTNADNLEVRQGHDHLLATGTWAKGDPGFEKFRTRYMEEMLWGFRARLDQDRMADATIDHIQLADTPEGVRPRQRDVYVIFSTGDVHVIEGGSFENSIDGGRDPSGNFARLGLILAGIAAMSAGFLRIGRGARSDIEPTLAESA